MSNFLRISVLAFAAAGVYAQTVTPVAPATTTSGVIGVAQGQTARLNVLNPGIPAPAVGTVCAAQLTILDGQGKVLKTAAVSVDPGTIAAIAIDGDVDLRLIADERREVRAIVTSSCSLIATLEIFDKLTGKTQVVLGGMHAVPHPAASN